MAPQWLDHTASGHTKALKRNLGRKERQGILGARDDAPDDALQIQAQMQLLGGSPRAAPALPRGEGGRQRQAEAGRGRQRQAEAGRRDQSHPAMH
jgi:hypothetical protein